MINNNSECLYNWVFHYNPYTKLWSAVHRDNYNKYWDDQNNPKLHVFKSTDISTLFEILYKLECDPERIVEL